MKTSFLEYYKIVLEKVSFDPHLLAKEYRKATQMLNTRETKDLDRWLQHRGLAVNPNSVTYQQRKMVLPEERLERTYH